MACIDLVKRYVVVRVTAAFGGLFVLTALRSPKESRATGMSFWPVCLWPNNSRVTRMMFAEVIIIVPDSPGLVSLLHLSNWASRLFPVTKHVRHTNLIDNAILKSGFERPDEPA